MKFSYERKAIEPNGEESIFSTSYSEGRVHSEDDLETVSFTMASKDPNSGEFKGRLDLYDGVFIGSLFWTNDNRYLFEKPSFVKAGREITGAQYDVHEITDEALQQAIEACEDKNNGMITCL